MATLEQIEDFLEREFPQSPFVVDAVEPKYARLRIATDDSHLQWEPAAAKEVQNTGYAKVSVLIDSDNKYYVNGNQVGIAQLSSAISDLLVDAPEDERTVLLKVHREATANHFEPVIEAISETGGTLVHVLDKEQPK